MMRIASLLPSATEIVCALGLADYLVGVSHECDYPADVVADLPILTQSAVPTGLSSTEAEWATLAKPVGWEQIPAVQQGRVYAFDASSYCSRPAPRVVDGVERLAALLHPMR